MSKIVFKKCKEISRRHFNRLLRKETDLLTVKSDRPSIQYADEPCSSQNVQESPESAEPLDNLSNFYDSTLDLSDVCILSDRSEVSDDNEISDPGGISEIGNCSSAYVAKIANWAVTYQINQNALNAP